MDKAEATLLLWLLRDVKTAWDLEAMGDHHWSRDQVYARLQGGIEALTAIVGADVDATNAAGGQKSMALLREAPPAAQTEGRGRIRLGVRLHRAGKLVSHEPEIIVGDYDAVEALAAKHREATVLGEIDMVEIELLDEPEQNERFIRIRVATNGRVDPIAIILDGLKGAQNA